MRRLIALAVIAFAALTATPAHATEGGCETEVAGVIARHTHEWVEAGRPTINCIPNNGDGVQGRTDGNTIYIETQPSDANYAPLAAHELGHAWANAHEIIPNVSYGDARGFPRPVGIDGVYRYGAVLHEDYAETFAWALGEWHPLVNVKVGPPYAFQHEAGMPNGIQIAVLQDLGLMPVPYVFVGASCDV